MPKTLLLLASMAAGAVALAAPASKAMPLAPAGQDSGVVQAHGVRICDDDGDCWWSYRRHSGGYWDDDHDHGWRHGYRHHDGDYDYRRYRRDYDRDERDERSEYRDRDRYGRWDDERGGIDRDKHHERQGMEKNREREQSARDEGKEQGREYRSEQGMKEHGGQSKKD
ncbi:hypothetical protein [Methylocystis sp. JR02]|uniref:hypothetical protein n=1 Tax=Methylocystis sp. JR02 TaxID=3046284 RepID=UPI0024B9D6F9|nr:hypothetical protein [Methylocystis sp. JR02]MDJ0448661.1 hypothetical protein [Methylocystis sp. JR02]